MNNYHPKSLFLKCYIGSHSFKIFVTISKNVVQYYDLSLIRLLIQTQITYHK